MGKSRQVDAKKCTAVDVNISLSVCYIYNIYPAVRKHFPSQLYISSAVAS